MSENTRQMISQWEEQDQQHDFVAGPPAPKMSKKNYPRRGSVRRKRGIPLGMRGRNRMKTTFISMGRGAQYAGGV